MLSKDQHALVEIVFDRICDVCNESVMIDISGHKYHECGELKAVWGYASKQDGDSYHLDLCEHCFNIALLALRDHLRQITMFDKEQKFSDDKLGLRK